MMSEILLPKNWSLQWLEEVDSTNDYLKRNKAAHGSVVVADRQTAGRGRRGAPWVSQSGDSLTFSVKLQPDEPRALWPRLALSAGLAVAEGIGKLGIEAGVKWPNDVWINGRKVSGVLVEAVDDGVIVGIGLNVNTSEFPDSLTNTATSLCIEDGVERTREEVLERILPSLAMWSANIGRAFPDLVERVRERCVLTGNTVSLKTAEATYNGTVKGIGDSGELLLETQDGMVSLIQADEVRITS